MSERVRDREGVRALRREGGVGREGRFYKSTSNEVNIWQTCSLFDHVLLNVALRMMQGWRLHNMKQIKMMRDDKKPSTLFMGEV